jgi:adenosine/AMP kinase
MSSPARILVVAHRTAATPKLLEQVRARAREGACSFVLLVPRPYWDPDTEEAARVIELAVPLLEEAAAGGVEAIVGDTDPFIAVKTALEGSRFDEVIISTLPTRVSHWLGLDLPARVERLGVPVTVVTAAQVPATAAGGLTVQSEGKIELYAVAVEKPDELNVILGQAHFIKTVEDLHEALVGAAPQLRFGVAFCESSGPRLVRRSGNDPELVELAARNALAIGAGHSFVVFLRNGFPINVLNQIKLVPEVCRIYCASANPVQVIVCETAAGRGILGVVDGGSPLGVESEADVVVRMQLLRGLGYKL